MKYPMIFSVNPLFVGEWWSIPINHHQIPLCIYFFPIYSRRWLLYLMIFPFYSHYRVAQLIMVSGMVTSNILSDWNRTKYFNISQRYISLYSHSTNMGVNYQLLWTNFHYIPTKNFLESSASGLSLSPYKFLYGGFLKWWYPQIIPLILGVAMKKTIQLLRYPNLWKPQYKYIIIMYIYI